MAVAVSVPVHIRSWRKRNGSSVAHAAAFKCAACSTSCERLGHHSASSVSFLLYWFSCRLWILDSGQAAVVKLSGESRLKMAVGFKPADTVQQLHQERLRLLNAVDHLQQSNAALEEESRSDSDPELREALGV